jgi:hypothetical protein
MNTFNNDLTTEELSEQLSPMPNKITPELVKLMYDKLPNKQLFIANFGTTKFYCVSEDLLKKIYLYLIKNVEK